MKQWEKITVNNTAPRCMYNILSNTRHKLFLEWYNEPWKTLIYSTSYVLKTSRKQIKIRGRILNKLCWLFAGDFGFIINEKIHSHLFTGCAIMLTEVSTIVSCYSFISIKMNRKIVIFAWKALASLMPVSMKPNHVWHRFWKYFLIREQNHFLYCAFFAGKHFKCEPIYLVEKEKTLKCSIGFEYCLALSPKKYFIQKVYGFWNISETSNPLKLNLKIFS